jgi:hypothetical protein
MVTTALTLLSVIAVGVGGPPSAARENRAKHRTRVFSQATIFVEREAAGGTHQIVASSNGKVTVRLRPGRYKVRAIANDRPGGQSQPPCGRTETVVIRRKEKPVRLKLYCQIK